MEAKKSSRANIDAKTTLFRQIGFVIALLLVIFAFQWNFGKQNEFSIENGLEIEIEEEIADVTKHKEILPPPPPPTFEIVPDDSVPKNDDTLNLFLDPDDTFAFHIPYKEPDEIIEDVIRTVVDEYPQFPGGRGQLNRFISQNVIYPEYELKTGIQGLVYVTFVVNKDGSITDIAILQGVSRGLDREALRVVRSMPIWEPGRVQGREVRVQVNLPITFRIRN